MTIDSWNKNEVALMNTSNIEAYFTIFFILLTLDLVNFQAKWFLSISKYWLPYIHSSHQSKAMKSKMCILIESNPIVSIYRIKWTVWTILLKECQYNSGNRLRIPHFGHFEMWKIVWAQYYLKMECICFCYYYILQIKRIKMTRDCGEKRKPM